jgi:putative endonuclease
VPRFYTGQPSDLVNRVLKHNSGETKSINSCVPWRVVWSIVVSSRADAVKLETKIKKRGAGRFLNDNKIPISRGA